MKFLHIVSLILFISCTSNSDNSGTIDLSSLPVETPEKLLEIDKIGDDFFQHLNYRTIVTKNGNVILNDRQGEFVAEIDPQGDLVKKHASSGRGPGEIQDVLSLDYSKEELLMYDQRRKRIIRKNLQTDEIQEYEDIRTEDFQTSRSYSTSDENTLLIHLWSTAYLTNKNETPKIAFTHLNLDSQTSGKLVGYPSRNMARLIIDDQVRGASQVPFAPDLYYDISPDRTSLFVLWADDPQIAVLDIMRLDTIRTIPADLPRDEISRTEIDSLQKRYDGRWRDIRDHLPERKAVAENMIVDDQYRIWLQLTRESDFQEWVVLDMDGNPQKIVRFPEGVMITHISRHHIGVRLDDHIFALYEAL
ncbi:MAG: hypothetical protein ACFCU6_10695 [Balneolaceae bacterium]